LIIYDHTTVTATQTLNLANSININIKFSLTKEIDADISFLVLLIHGTTTVIIA
jgi:hypothetical protein